MEQKPCQKEDPVWSILPSYDMYQNTFNGSSNPPQYGEPASAQESMYSSQISSEVVTETTAVTSYENLANVDAAVSILSSSSPSLIIADESTTTWRETLLDNIDNLRNYSSSDNPYTKNVELSLHFTADVGKGGEAPKHIDPLQFEYKQGDYLNGYIYIKNKCDVPIPFDMFYVLFEGNFTVTDKKHAAKKKQVKVKKYLEMYDFAASWNESRIDRLLSETNDDQYSCPKLVDPLDGSSLCMLGRVLKPGILYKRFFTFKIPSRLLDTECNDHNLPSHTALPPTLGLSEQEKEIMGNPYEKSSDFSFLDTSTSYGVMARFIGKASNFKVNDKFDLATKLIDVKGDEFIIFRECMSYIRVIQESNMPSNSEKLVNAETSRILYENLVGRIKEKIELGNQIKQTLAAGGTVPEYPHPASFLLQSPGDHACEEHKARQLYTRLDDLSKGTGPRLAKPKDYKISMPLIKKKFLGAVKYQGMLQISSPKTEYILNYMSPKRFDRDTLKKKQMWKLEIPVKIRFEPADASNLGKVPHITHVTPELVVFTMKAGKFPVPIELTHDHLFRNQSCKLVDLKLTDNFEYIVKRPMRRYASELYELVKELGCDQFKVEKSLLEDVCALAGVEEKTNNLILRESKLVDEKGTSRSLESSWPIELESKNGVFSKDFTVVVDANKAQKKTLKLEQLPSNYSSADEFCLVPSFQNCNIARMYYLRLIIGFSTGEKTELKLPLTIAKIPNN
ncbi:Bul1 C terminus [Metschnikowia aff. pulcherrima]|uniref:Bul1 C terminus n=1 Tax=Metschnikowia aff. pulcherrima TaxID=2163413 RepID=A0A4P6XMP8_9ASCO|nr:Bul1 C terminus [Metschnikowia aff. pulcherrima]